MAQYLVAIHRDIDVLNEEMTAFGCPDLRWWLARGEQREVAAGAVDGKVLIIDGPCLETKEHIGGFWVMEAADMNQAPAWGRKAAVACRAPVEVRPFH